MRGPDCPRGDTDRQTHGHRSGCETTRFIKWSLFTYGDRGVMFSKSLRKHTVLPSRQVLRETSQGTFRLFFHESRVMSQSHPVPARLNASLAPHPASPGGAANLPWGPSVFVSSGNSWACLTLLHDSGPQERGLGVLRSCGGERLEQTNASIWGNDYLSESPGCLSLGVDRSGMSKGRPIHLGVQSY